MYAAVPLPPLPECRLVKGAQDWPRGLQIREMGGSIHSASVPVISITYQGKIPLVLAAGTIVEGGFQNRMLAQTLMLPAGDTTVYAQVLCAEKGRWAGNSARFTRLKSPPDGMLNALAVSAGKQQMLWKCVDTMLARQGIKSATANASMLRNSAERVYDTLVPCSQGWWKNGKGPQGWLALYDKQLYMGESWPNAALAKQAFTERINAFWGANIGQLLPAYTWPPPTAVTHILRAGQGHEIVTFTPPAAP